jgi:hypothetical protein
MRRFLRGLGFSAKNPPNAAPVVAGARGAEETLVIELFAPRYDRRAKRLSYDARLLDDAGESALLARFAKRGRRGRPPRRFADASLFIDSCPSGGVVCTGPPIPPPGVTVANKLPCCWHWDGCQPCDNRDYTDVCSEHVAGCQNGICEGVGRCIL